MSKWILVAALGCGGQAADVTVTAAPTRPTAEEKAGATTSRCGLWTFTMDEETLQASEDLTIKRMAPIYGGSETVCAAFKDVFVERSENPDAPFYVQASPGVWAYVGAFADFSPYASIHINGQPPWNAPFAHELAHVLDWRVRRRFLPHHDDWDSEGIDQATWDQQMDEFKLYHDGLDLMQWAGQQ